MASNSNITTVHFSLIAFVMISIVAIAVAWMKSGEADEHRAIAARATQEKSDLDAKWNDAQDEFNELKKVVGVDGEHNLDSQTPENIFVKIGKLLDDIRGPEGTRQDTLKLVLEEVNSVYGKTGDELASTIIELNKQKAEIAELEKRYAENVVNLKKDLSEARDAHAKLQASINEQLKPKNDLIAQLSDDKRRLTGRIDQLQTTQIAELKALNQRITTLRTTVQRQERILANFTQESFEQADGEIIHVSSRLRLVQINLGSADNLPRMGTFAVYARSNNGIARGEKIDPNNPHKKLAYRKGPVDIKGKIEISRILGPHTAEARILAEDGDIFRPLAKGDLIYSPAFTPGLVNSFAFAGIQDMDADGDGDSAQMIAFVRQNGGLISNFVDDKEVHVRKGISVLDKFLVVGTLPDYSKSRPDQKEAHKRLLDEYTKMIEEAQDHGVRIIPMNNFLDYMGYKASRRLWRPGVDPTRPLHAGALSATTTEAGGRKGSGTISGLYSKNNRLKLNRSSGKVSELYKSGGKK